MSAEPHEAATQQTMFLGDSLKGLRGDGLNYKSLVAYITAGVTYHQLDYWARTGLLQPSVRAARDPDFQRFYSFKDTLILEIAKRLLDTGVPLQQVRTAAAQLQDRGVDDLASIILMSDGASVYGYTSTDEVIDLLQGGQGIFGIAVGRVWYEVEGTLADPPTERLGGEPVNELAGRRRRRRSAS